MTTSIYYEKRPHAAKYPELTDSLNWNDVQDELATVNERILYHRSESAHH